MDWLQVVVLALLQGLTEFLPISSSAHLILVPVILGWPDQGIAFDVAVQVGTLGAVVSYFRRELSVMVRDLRRSLLERRAVGHSRLAWYVGIGTIPVGLAGLVLTGAGADWLRSPVVIATATVGFGVLLGWADRCGGGTRDEHGLRLRDVIVIGGAQALALIPGTSRSGITITAALLVGMSREAAARFSFLLSIPVIVLAAAVELAEAWSAPASALELAVAQVVVGAALAWLAAYLSIDWFLRLVERIGLMPFVVYRLALGAILLALYA
jgi:undecaprenyl-diphosphatase